jgi:hypothetical protein
MDARVIDRDGIERRDLDELPLLLEREDVLHWVDIPSWDQIAREVLAELFGFHWLAGAGLHRTQPPAQIPRLGGLPLRRPARAAGGTPRSRTFVELDQFTGRNFLVTVHGPLSPAVDPAVALLDHDSPPHPGRAATPAVTVRLPHSRTGQGRRLAATGPDLIEFSGGVSRFLPISAVAAPLNDVPVILV